MMLESALRPGMERFARFHQRMALVPGVRYSHWSRSLFSGVNTVPPTIQRTWNVFFKQWSTWSREDPNAQLLLEMLQDLGEAVNSHEFGRLASSDNVQEARQIHKKWNERATVKHTERDEMHEELSVALTLVDGALLASITTHRPRRPDEGEWPSNVYISGQSKETDYKAVTCKNTSDIKAHRGPSLQLEKMILDDATLSALKAHPKLKSLIFRGCQYPSDWNDTTLAQLELRKLVFYACNKSSWPVSRLASIQACASLRILELVMADFLHDVECYENLSKMRQLTTLNISRTMTLEKAKLESQNALELMMKALTSLIDHGDLIELNVAYCSSFMRNDLLKLAEGLAKKGGRLIISSETATGNKLRG